MEGRDECEGGVESKGAKDGVRPWLGPTPAPGGKALLGKSGDCGGDPSWGAVPCPTRPYSYGFGAELESREKRRRGKGGGGGAIVSSLSSSNISSQFCRLFLDNE